MGYRVAPEMVKRLGMAGVCLNTTGAEDVAGGFIFQYKQVVLVARAGYFALEACHGMGNLLCQSVPVEHQRCETWARLFGYLIKSVQIFVCNWANNHEMQPGAVSRQYAFKLCRFAGTFCSE